jgi:hypothetical protein
VRLLAREEDGSCFSRWLAAEWLVSRPFGFPIQNELENSPPSRIRQTGRPLGSVGI